MKRIAFVAAVAAAVFAAPAVSQRAEALPAVKQADGKSAVVEAGRRGGFRMRGHGGFRGFRHGGFHAFHGGRRFHGGPRWHRHGWRHRHWRRGWYGPTVGIHYGGGYGRCAWLRHKAYSTGSRYWWRRYRHCRRGWY